MTGKPVGADIRRKKNSYPVVCAMESATRTRTATPSPEYTASRSLKIETSIRSWLSWTGQGCGSAPAWSGASGQNIAMQALTPVEMSAEAKREIEDFIHFLMVKRQVENVSDRYGWRAQWQGRWSWQQGSLGT